MFSFVNDCIFSLAQVVGLSSIYSLNNGLHSAQIAGKVGEWLYITMLQMIPIKSNI